MSFNQKYARKCMRRADEYCGGWGGVLYYNDISAMRWQFKVRVALKYPSPCIMGFICNDTAHVNSVLTCTCWTSDGGKR